MVSIPISSGIGVKGADITTSMPVNLVQVPKNSGVSEGYIRPAPGIVPIGNGPGFNRGGARWRDALYRVMGGFLVRIAEDGTFTSIGAIAGTDWCSFAESFDYLAICGGGNLYLYDGTLLSQVTDVDLGASLDVEWINGYFISTDGEFIVVTDLLDPFSVSPLRYASSEVSPDPVVSLFALRNELYAVNRYTIETFGALSDPGLGFPFQRIEGAQIARGAVGGRAVCALSDALAFLGGGQNEPPSVYVGGVKVATRQIEDELRRYSDEQLAAAVLEAQSDRMHEWLFVHLPDQSLVFDVTGSALAGQPLWHVRRSEGTGYRARGMVWCYARWNVADPFGTGIGYLADDRGSHYGTLTRWQFDTPILYNKGRGAQVHMLELVAMNGVSSLTDDAMIGTAWSADGVTFSQPRYVRAGRRGERGHRLAWDRQGMFRHWRIQRFTGDSRAHLAFARLEADIEGLSA